MKDVPALDFHRLQKLILVLLQDVLVLEICAWVKLGYLRLGCLRIFVDLPRSQVDCIIWPQE